jgi:RNA polymerase sigma factor for flagellar operon FliA
MYTAVGTMDKQHYVVKYSPLVRRIAHHMMSRLPASVQLGDLVQAGLMGLMDAATRYEEEQGVQFETYASQRIRGAILDELRANDWLPRGVRKSQRQVDAALTRLEHRLGRSPRETEIAAELGLSLEDYQDLLLEVQGHQLLHYEDFSSDGDGNDFLERLLPENRADPLSMLSDERIRQGLIAAIGQLPEREKLLMAMYYEQDLNFKEIAAVLGVTESRVCQLHGQAISRLRVRMKEH